jgi:hypothetical protein
MLLFTTEKAPNGGVDAAARIHSSIAGPIMMRNTLPPLASNDLLCALTILAGRASVAQSTDKEKGKPKHGKNNEPRQ